MAAYLTPGEFKAAPTGVDLSTLIKYGDATAQLNSLRETIARAGSWIDNEVNQPLLAGRYVDISRVRCTRDGWIFRPKTCQMNLTLISLEIGPSISGLLTLPITDAYVDSRQFIVPGSSLSGPVQLGGARNGTRALARCTYTAGWPFTTLTGGTYNPGTTSMTVANTTGITTGIQMWIVDAEKVEAVTVASVAGSTVTFTAATTGTYAASNEVALTAVPRDLRTAAIQATAWLLKSRGADGLNVTQLAAPAPQQPSTAGGLNLYTARSILHPSYNRIV